MDSQTLGLLALLLSAAVMALTAWMEVWMQKRMQGFPPVQWLLSNRRSLWISCSLLRILVYAALAAGFFWMWLCLEPPFLSELFCIFGVGCAMQASIRLGLMVPILKADAKRAALTLPGARDTPGVPGSQPGLGRPTGPEIQHGPGTDSA